MESMKSKYNVVVYTEPAEDVLSIYSAEFYRAPEKHNLHMFIKGLFEFKYGRWNLHEIRSKLHMSVNDLTGFLMRGDNYFKTIGPKIYEIPSHRVDYIVLNATNKRLRFKNWRGTIYGLDAGEIIIFEKDLSIRHYIEYENGIYREKDNYLIFEGALPEKYEDGKLVIPEYVKDMEVRNISCLASTGIVRDISVLDARGVSYIPEYAIVDLYAGYVVRKLLVSDKIETIEETALLSVTDIEII